MRRIQSWAAIVFLGSAVLCSAVSAGVGEKSFLLKEDLSLGVEQGDENLMFGDISDIELDAEGNIYIVDWKNSRVQKFDEQGKFLRSVPIKQGQGPEEVAMLAGIAVTPEGTIFVLDQAGKMLVLNKDGDFIRNFKLDFQGPCARGLPGNRVVVLGLHEDKLLHVYDQAGKLLASFADPFEIPSHLSQYKDMPLLKHPLRFNCSRDGNIFVLNPHKFEISVYKDAQLVKKLEGRSGLFQPAQVPVANRQRMGIVFPWVSVQESGNRTYLTVYQVGGKGQHELSIYENDRFLASLKVDGFPHAVDGKGRLYFSEEVRFPRLVRCIVQEK